MELLTFLAKIYALFCVILTTFWLISVYIKLRHLAYTEDAIELVKNHARFVYIDKVEDNLLMYDLQTNSFIAQGPTKEQLFNTAKAMFPNKEFIIAERSQNS